MAFDCFEFSAVETQGRTIKLAYRLSGGNQPDINFVERLTLSDNLPEVDEKDPVAARLLDGIHRVLGVSYFKTFAPKKIIAAPVSAEDQAFWNMMYTEGMGEFWYRNDIDPRGRVNFPCGAEPALPAKNVAVEAEKALLLVGGGKDSAVAGEAVRHAGVPALAFTLGNSHWQSQSIAALGLEHVFVSRELDPELMRLNKQGALNGHIPISACIAFVAELVAYLTRCSHIVVANERSADEGNVQWNDLHINHQWSKSSRFEAMFQQWCLRHLDTPPRYFSLLRDLSELQIAEVFARQPRHFQAFTSCNRNFSQQRDGEVTRWCGRCAKCIFSQLILTPFLSAEEVEQIFSRDFLSSSEGHEMLAQLVGLHGTKPFDCVGTQQECIEALDKLYSKGSMSEPLRRWYEQNMAKLSERQHATQRHVATESSKTLMPSEWSARLHAYRQA